MEYRTRHMGGPLLYRSPNQNSPLDNLPLDLVTKIGGDGLAGVEYYFNHFLRWEGPVAEGSAGGWTLSGTTGAATIVLSDVRQGEITLTGDATGSANPTLALGSATVGMNFTYVVGKQLWCLSRMKIATVATTEVFFGFGTADTSPTVTGTLPSDGIFLSKASTDTKFALEARQNGTSTKNATWSATLVDATYTVVGFYVDIAGNIWPVQEMLPVTASVVATGNTNIPDAGADVMQFMVGILGASMTLSMDWLLIAQEK